MSLNQLLFNHQLANMHAKSAKSDGDRETYLDLVGHYAHRIEELRAVEGLSSAGWPRDERRDTAGQSA